MNLLNPLRILAGEVFGIDHELLGTKTRKERIVAAMQCVRYSLVMQHGYHYEKVAELTKRDRTTILHSLSVVETLKNPKYNNRLTPTVKRFLKRALNAKPEPSSTVALSDTLVYSNKDRPFVLFMPNF